MSSRSPLEQLLRFDRSSSKFHDRVSNILYGEEYKQWVQSVQGEDLVRFVEFLDEALGILDPAGSAFRKCLRELRHVCGTRTILPPSHTLSPQDLVVGRRPVASGGSGDVYEGWLDGLKVCVKRVRIYSRDGPEKATKTLYQEAIVWKHLEHKNIVPLLGITPAPLQLISKWMPGGDLPDYIRNHPDADRLGLLSDVAEGLHFLHSRNIVHGDLKGPNILVDDTEQARITDFGIATVTQNLDSIRSASEHQGHTARWTAPEILNEEGTYSKEADVFAFAMVMIEVFTGAVPFRNSLPAAAVLAIMNGERPQRPTHQHFTNKLWTLMQRCWDKDPQLRPEVSEVFKVLRGRDLPLIKPTIYRLTSTSTLKTASTLTLGPPLLAGYNPTAPQPPSPRGTLSSTPRQNPQLALQKSTNSSPTSFPENKGGDAGFDEGGSSQPHNTSSQTATQGSSSDTDHCRLNKEQGGQSDGHVSSEPSRRSTAASDPSPTPKDPRPFDFDNLQRRRDVHSDGSDGNEGKYWLETPRRKGGSHSALNVVGVDQVGCHPNSQSRNHSSTHLLNNLSKSILTQYNKSKTSVKNLGKNASRLNLVNPSKQDLSRMNGYANGNAYEHELPNGTKSRHQSRLNLHETLRENPDVSLSVDARAHVVQKPLSGQANHTGQTHQQMNGHHGNVGKIHGFWCRLKHKLGLSKPRK